MTNADIVTGNADYQGTQNAVLRDFELFHEGNPIFQKNLMDLILVLLVSLKILLSSLNISL